MEYRFRAKKTQITPEARASIVIQACIIGWYFSRNPDDPRWIGFFLLILGLIFLRIYYIKLSRKIILTISDAGISYSGNDYIFAPKLENILSDQLS